MNKPTYHRNMVLMRMNNALAEVLSASLHLQAMGDAAHVECFSSKAVTAVERAKQSLIVFQAEADRQESQMQAAQMATIIGAGILSPNLMKLGTPRKKRK